MRFSSIPGIAIGECEGDTLIYLNLFLIFRLASLRWVRIAWMKLIT